MNVVLASALFLSFLFKQPPSIVVGWWDKVLGLHLQRFRARNEKWVISKILNYFSSSTVFGVIRFSYFEFNHNVAETAKLSKGDFAKRHCNTETVDSNTDQTSACITFSLVGWTHLKKRIDRKAWKILISLIGKEIIFWRGFFNHRKTVVVSVVYYICQRIL